MVRGTYKGEVPKKLSRTWSVELTLHLLYSCSLASTKTLIDHEGVSNVTFANSRYAEHSSSGRRLGPCPFVYLKHAPKQLNYHQCR